MTQVTARLPEDLVRQIDETARHQKKSRAELIRRAIEDCLEDVKDLALGIERLNDPADPVLDWDEVRRMENVKISFMDARSHLGPS